MLLVPLIITGMVKNVQENSKKCALYLKENSGFQRFMKSLRKKYMQLGRFSGTITLKLCSQQEKDDIQKIMGIIYRNDTIIIKVVDFEHAVQTSRFAPVDMLEVLQYYFNEEIITNKAIKYNNQQKLQTFFDECLVYDDGWLQQAINEKKYGYYRIVGEYNRNDDITSSVIYVLEALKELQGIRDPIRLAILATKVSGNPHLFDRNQFCGELLLDALRYRFHSEVQTSHEILQLYMQASIVPDDISSNTAIFNIDCYSNGKLHLGIDGFNREKQCCIVTLSTASTITEAKAKHNTVFIVENQMVFSHLVELFSKEDVSIMCTSGQLKIASIYLLKALNDVTCYYAGDFDPEGIMILDRLMQQYSFIKPWRMGVTDYEKAKSNEVISDSRLFKLSKTEMIDLKEMITQYKVAGYQEALIKEYEEDIRLFLSGEKTMF